MQPNININHNGSRVSAANPLPVTAITTTGADLGVKLDALTTSILALLQNVTLVVECPDEPTALALSALNPSILYVVPEP